MKKTSLLMAIALAATGLTACNKTGDDPNKKPNKEEYKEGANEEVLKDIEANDDCTKEGEVACGKDGVPYECVSDPFGLGLLYWDAINYDKETYEPLACGEGTVCKVSKDGTTAGCVVSCKDGSKDSASCDIDELYTQYYGQDISSASSAKCEMATDGKYYIFENKELCEHGCDGNNCKTLTSDEGKSCDENTFTERCDGSIGVFCDSGIVSAFDCGENTTFNTCAVAKIDGSNWADCTIPCTGEDVKQCDLSYKETAGVELLQNFKCLETIDGGHAAYQLSSDDYEICSSCANNVCTVSDADKGKDLKPGDACNPNLFEIRCSDTGVVTCKQNTKKEYVVTESKCGTGETCKSVMLEGSKAFGCSVPCDGKDVLHCDDSLLATEHFTVLMNMTCMDTTDGSKAAFHTSSAKDQICSSCANNVCTVSDADKGKDAKAGDTCIPELFEARCDGNNIIECDEGKVVSEDCNAEAEDGEEFICLTSSDPKLEAPMASCTFKDTCDKDMSYCEDMFFLQVSYQFFCVTADDGKKHIFPGDSEMCLNGCSADGTTCAK